MEGLTRGQLLLEHQWQVEPSSSSLLQPPLARGLMPKYVPWRSLSLWCCLLEGAPEESHVPCLAAVPLPLQQSCAPDSCSISPPCWG